VSQPHGGCIREAQSVKPTLEVIVHQGSRRYEAEMLVDGGATVNLIPYSVLKKLGRENDELVKINLTLNGMGGPPDGGQMCRLHVAYYREKITH
jgi:hypothetical protein